MKTLGRRDFLRLAGVSAAALAAGPATANAAAKRGDRLNVLFLAVDDLRTELGCYGCEGVLSPRIDRLAAEGMLFTHAYCQQAICAPSRASLLSGCRPDTTGIYGLNTPLRRAMPDVLSLPQHFKNSGYVTVSLGKIYHHHNDDKQGWTERPQTWTGLYVSEELNARRKRLTAEGRKKGLTSWRLYNYAAGPSTEMPDCPDNAAEDGRIADEAVAAIRRHKDRPFFLAAGFKKPHLPFVAPKRYWDMYDPAKIDLPAGREPKGAPPMAFTNWGELRSYSDIPAKGDLDAEQTRHLIHAYRACVTYVDTQIGRILDELDRQGLADRTVVILWGDHGWKLGEYRDWSKHTNFELDTHVPMILRTPGRGRGKRCGALTEFVDIYPTLAELCGLGVPAHCEGTSMVPLLADPDRAWKSAAFSQYPRRDLMGYSLRTRRWRYTEWQQRKTGACVARELYDHAETDLAGRNLAGDADRAELVERLAKMLADGWKAARPGA